MALLTDTLHRFDLKQSDDPVKTDLELTCSECGEVLCDVEADDNLGVLATVADNHACAAEPDEDEGVVSERAARQARGQVGWEGNTIPEVRIADDPDDDEVEAIQNEVEADEGGYHEESEDAGIVAERSADERRICLYCGQRVHRAEGIRGLLVDERTGDWWCRANPSNGGDAAPHEVG